MLEVNTYVVWDEKSREAVVIDAACYYPHERTALADFIDGEQLKVVHLLNTHLHFDHIFGNPFMSDRYGVKPEAAREDEEWISQGEERIRLFGLSFPEPPIAPGHYLKDGDRLTFGSYSFTCLAVPGHSRGSLVFHCAEEQCLFAGDVLFKGSIGRTDLPGSTDNLVENIHTRLLTLPDETRVYPGHGPATTIGDERRGNWHLMG